MNFVNTCLEYSLKISLQQKNSIRIDHSSTKLKMNNQDTSNYLGKFSLDQIEELGKFMPGGFFIYKAYGDERLLYANDIVLDIFGCETLDEFRELTGFTFPGMVFKDDLTCVTNTIDHQIQEDKKNLDYVEYRILRKNGEIRWVDDYGRLVHTDKYGDVFFVLIRDITEQHIARETLTDTDHLTTVYNRRYFDRELMRCMSRISHFGGKVSLIMIDIDKFKDFNDKYGHLAGDHCLTQVANAMRGALRRKGDMIFRYGGEEFAVILPGADIAGATAVAENICNAVRNLHIQHQLGPKGIVTVSAGIAKIEASAVKCSLHPCAEIIRLADAALYAAKAAGRDNVCSQSS